MKANGLRATLRIVGAVALAAGCVEHRAENVPTYQSRPPYQEQAAYSYQPQTVYTPGAEQASSVPTWTNSVPASPVSPAEGVGEEPLPRIPAPIGFVDGSGLSEKIRAKALAGEPSSVKVLGAYYTTNTLAEMLNDQPATLAPFCKATLKKDYVSVAQAKEGFEVLVANSKRESATPFDPSDPAIKRIWKSQEDARREVDPNSAAKPVGMSFLGGILDTDTAFAASAIGNFEFPDGQDSKEVPFALSFAIVRLGKRQVDLAVAYPFSGQESIECANRTLLKWVQEIGKSNETLPERAEPKEAPAEKSDVLARLSVPKEVEGILIPPPRNMVDMSDFSGWFQRLAKAGLEPGQTLIGLYYLLGEIPELKNQTISAPSRWAKANIFLSFPSEDMAKKGFQDEMNQLERDIPAINFSSKEMKELIDKGGEDVRMVPGLAGVDAKGLTWIEKNLPKEGPCYLIALANITIPNGEKDKEYTLVYCCGWQRVRNKVIQLAYDARFEGEQSIDIGRKELQQWFEIVEKANQAPK